MRLDKYLTDCFLGTRKEAKTLIKKGLIKVNDKIIIKEDYNINESMNISTIEAIPIINVHTVCVLYP